MSREKLYAVTGSDSVSIVTRTTTEWEAAVEECAWWAEKMADRMRDGVIEVSTEVPGSTGTKQVLHRVEVKRGIITTRTFPEIT